MGIERVFISIYALSLRLYPREFRQAFGDEMQVVFTEAVSRQQGLAGLLRVAGCELKQLPVSLLREHWDVWRSRMNAKERRVVGPSGGSQHWLRPPRSWQEALLGASPFILIFTLVTIPNLLMETGVLTQESTAMDILNIALGLLLVVTFFVVLLLAFRRGWPLWSATWVLFFWLLVFLPLGWLFSLVLPDQMNRAFQDLNVFIGLPLLIAAILYWVTRADRLRGQLAALPILFFLWRLNLEETPLTQIPLGVELLVDTASTLLVSLAVFTILRGRDWRRALWIILMTMLAVGLGYSYVGIYHGGTLPFSAPGPSPVEVVRSFLPQYLAVCSILLGPLFARRFREFGRRSGVAGYFAYHLALVGLLLVISLNLMGQVAGTGSGAGDANALLYAMLGRLLAIALGGYVLGSFLLFRLVWRGEPRPDGVEIALLFLLPLAIPITFVLPFITWKWPVSELYGIPALWVIPDTVTLGAGLAWLLLSIWVITRTEGNSASPAAVPQLV